MYKTTQIKISRHYVKLKVNALPFYNLSRKQLKIVCSKIEIQPGPSGYKNILSGIRAEFTAQTSGEIKTEANNSRHKLPRKSRTTSGF
jgi:hypothetical protein